MSVCDVCNTSVEGTKIRAQLMQKAAAEGFTPFNSPYVDPHRLESWRMMVQANATDWNLCGECLRRFRAYLPAGKDAIGLMPELPGSKILAGHEERLMDVAISSDGSRVLTSGWDETVRLWEFATGKELACLREHRSFVATVALAPDGRTAASGGSDQVIRVWDLERRTVIHRLKGHTYGVFSLQFSKDGSRLISGSGDRTVQLWDVANGKRIRRFGGLFGGKHQSGVGSVAFSSDESRVFSVGGNAMLWDTESGKQVHVFKQTPLWDGAFLEDMQAIVSGPRGFTIFDLRTAGEVETINGLKANSGTFAVTRDGRLLTGGFGTVRLFNTKTRQMLFKVEGHSKRITAVAVSRDGRRAASASDDWTARTWQLT
jgi:WD40 repeat protein